MFGNSGYRLKLAGALAAAALLGVLSKERGDSINPGLRRCAAEPARWSGTVTWIASARVVAVSAGGFTLASDGVEMPVLGAADVAPGDDASVRGTFRAEGGPHLVLSRARRLVPHARLRWLMEAVSVAVLLLVLANLLRHFAFRPRVLQVKGQD